MKLHHVLATLLAALLLAAPAAAQTLLFEIFAAPGVTDPRRFSFQLDTTQPPRGPVIPGNSARFNGTPFTFTVPSGVGAGTISGTESGPFDGPTFSTTLNQGGVFIARIDSIRVPSQFQQNSFFGPQLFTGTTAAPQFRLGEFALTTTPNNPPGVVFDFRIRISQVASAVPEPATWATMLAGFGLVGVTLRRRPRPASIV